MVSVGIWAVGRLSRDDRAGMERLYRAYYEGADEGDFARDLAEKDWAIVLRDAAGVRGFSTMKLVRVASAKPPPLANPSKFAPLRGLATK
jgi:hypothetical protein